MNEKYINLYNLLIRLSTNKELYKSLTKQDTFSERLTLFLFHFAFFLKVFKSEANTKILQDIYDFIFRQLELSIREIGYGDQSINKKMKDYINVFHGIISEIHFWDEMNSDKKRIILTTFLENFKNTDYLIDYFNDFNYDLKKYDLNSYLKSVNKL